MFQPINETYTVDPFLQVPNSALAEGEDKSRDNLFLKVHNAEIDVDVGLVSVPTEALEDGGGKAKAKISVQSDIGDITVRLVCTFLEDSFKKLTNTINTALISPSSSSVQHIHRSRLGNSLRYSPALIPRRFQQHVKGPTRSLRGILQITQNATYAE